MRKFGSLLRPHNDQVTNTRLKLIAEALGKPLPSVVSPDLSASLGGLIDTQNHGQVWLALAVLSGELPDETTVIETVRNAKFDPAAVAKSVEKATTRANLQRNVIIATDQVIVDVTHTVAATFITGIQRVVLETVSRWLGTHAVQLVSWTPDYHAIRTLTAAETQRMSKGREATESEIADDDIAQTTLVVPWNSIYLIPELAADRERFTRLRAITRFSPNLVEAIGHDIIPLTTAETVHEGMAEVFPGYMSALRYADQIVATCESSATEFRGWHKTLTALGVPGPEINYIELPVAAVEVSESTLVATAERLLVGNMPMVLVVGTHEPRKNHLAILHAAELLWREGLSFSLTFIGGRSWNADEFYTELDRLQKTGYPIETVSGISDETLWAAYRLAAFTVFPSLNEGFGLPVAESLAVGTPVITSNFGSMKGIAEQGGCLLVDPRDDYDIQAAMRILLTHPELLADLRQQAANRIPRSWDQYAAELWDLMVSKYLTQSELITTVSAEDSHG